MKHPWASVGVVAAALAAITLIAVGIDVRTHVSAAAVGWLYLLVILPVTLRWGRAAGLATAGATLFLLLTFLTEPRGLPYTNNRLDLFRLMMSIGGVAVTVFSVGQVNRRSAGQDRLLDVLATPPEEAVVGHTPDGTILSWNAGAERLYGYRPEEVIGRSISCLFDSEDRQALPVMPDRLGPGGRILYRETVGCTKDGRRLDLALSTSLVADAQSRVTGASTTIHDITARKRIERTLDAGSEALGDAAEGLMDGVMLLDEQGRLLLANRAAQALFQRPQALIPGTTLGEILAGRQTVPDVAWRHVRRTPVSTFLTLEKARTPRVWLRLEISKLQVRTVLHSARFLVVLRDATPEVEAADDLGMDDDWADAAIVRIPPQVASTIAEPLATETETAQAPEPNGLPAAQRPPTNHPRLSAREAQILELIAQSRSNQQIADQLGISLNTVERHIANLYRKLGLRGRVDATAYALRHGADAVHPR